MESGLSCLKKWRLEITRVTVLRDGGAAGIGQWAVIQAMASPLGLELTPVGR